MRKGGFEPPRYCYRQPIKLARLRCRGANKRASRRAAPIDEGQTIGGLALNERPLSMFGIPVGSFTIRGDMNVVRSGHDACSMTDDDVV